MVQITEVYPASRAAKAGILSGDILVSIGGHPISDVLDYRFYLAERTVELSLLREEKKYSVTIKKGEYDDIGLCFETALMDEKQSCKNKCIFYCEILFILKYVYICYILHIQEAVYFKSLTKC